MRRIAGPLEGLDRQALLRVGRAQLVDDQHDTARTACIAPSSETTRSGRATWWRTRRQPAIENDSSGNGQRGRVTDLEAAVRRAPSQTLPRSTPDLRRRRPPRARAAQARRRAPRCRSRCRAARASRGSGARSCTRLCSSSAARCSLEGQALGGEGVVHETTRRSTRERERPMLVASSYPIVPATLACCSSVDLAADQGHRNAGRTLSRETHGEGIHRDCADDRATIVANEHLGSCQRRGRSRPRTRPGQCRSTSARTRRRAVRSPRSPRARAASRGRAPTPSEAPDEARSATRPRRTGRSRTARSRSARRRAATRGA